MRFMGCFEGFSVGCVAFLWSIRGETCGERGRWNVLKSTGKTCHLFSTFFGGLKSCLNEAKGALRGLRPLRGAYTGFALLPPDGRHEEFSRRPTGAATRRGYTRHEVTAPRAVGRCLMLRVSMICRGVMSFALWRVDWVRIVGLGGAGF